MAKAKSKVVKKTSKKTAKKTAKKAAPAAAPLKAVSESAVKGLKVADIGQLTEAQEAMVLEAANKLATLVLEDGVLTEESCSDLQTGAKVIFKALLRRSPWTRDCSFARKRTSPKRALQALGIFVNAINIGDASTEDVFYDKTSQETAVAAMKPLVDAGLIPAIGDDGIQDVVGGRAYMYFNVENAFQVPPSGVFVTVSDIEGNVLVDRAKVTDHGDDGSWYHHESIYSLDDGEC